MAELKLDPCAIRLVWAFPEAMDASAWARLLADYAETLAERCQSAGRCLIAHIKGFAPLPGGYARVNTTAPTVPADAVVRSSAPFAELTLSLNVLVYGLPAAILAELAMSTAADIASARGGTSSLLEKE